MKAYSSEEIITLTRQVACGKLAPTLAHKAKNILMPLTGYVELIEAGGISPVKVKEYYKKIEEAGGGLQLLLKRYLRLGCPSSERLEEKILLAEIVEDILSLFEHKLVLAKVKVEKKIGSEEAIVMANYDDLALIIGSLLFNALEAAPPGGKITLGLDKDSLMVSDDGPGVMAEIRDKIFEPFFTTKEGSLGLGLTAALLLSRRLKAELFLKGRNEFVLNLSHAQKDTRG